MRQRSAKAAAEHRRRIEWLRRTGADQARCSWPAGCPSRAVDAHELLSRARGGAVEGDNVVLLCRPHHDWVTTHPTDARALGLALDTPAPRRVASYAHTMRSMPAKRPLTLRVTDQAADWVAKAQSDTGTSQAVMLRAMLSVATQHRDEVLAKARTMADS